MSQSETNHLKTGKNIGLLQFEITEKNEIIKQLENQVSEEQQLNKDCNNQITKQ